MIASMNTPQFLDESRFFENEWEGENDQEPSVAGEEAMA